MNKVQFDILTLFPEVVANFFSMGILHRAMEEGRFVANVHNLRQFSTDPHGRIDDRPYGGGDGMIFCPEPLQKAIQFARQKNPGRKVIFLTPQGRTFDQKRAEEFVAEGGGILLCGRYGGIDERIRQLHIDEEISVGDYVLMGGELPALTILESTVRLIPGVLGNEGSIQEDSFQRGRLEGPQYTRPQQFEGLEVPKILLSGDHEAILAWKLKESEARTEQRRPDLLTRK